MTVFRAKLGIVVSMVCAAAQAADPVQLPGVDVVVTTPLPGVGQPLSYVPANVQTAKARDIDRQQTLDIVDFMNQNLSGVNVNQTQDNPFQVDVNFRGFAASPLLGTPQGLSVYVDGVRVNESFGDVVNWDLIPESAIASLSLIPGSNPSFGLNTLGGALSVQTKNGRQFGGTDIQAYGGSFGRRAAELETGGKLSRGFDYFLSGNYFDEDGWRDDSPSHVRQLFGKLGWHRENTQAGLSYTWADNNLIGNGFTPTSMLGYRRAIAFTVPDQTINHFNFVQAQLSQVLSPELLLEGNVYFRQLKTFSFNGDSNGGYSDDYEAAIVPGGVCAGDADPDACAAAALADDTGRNHAASTGQRRWGSSLQLTYSGRIGGRENSFTSGVSRDDGRNDFTQSQQDAALNPDRSTRPTGPMELLTSLYGTQRSSGFYASDTFTPTSQLHITASARYNAARIGLNDRIGTALNGGHGFYRINPAFGGTFTPGPALTLYADYNEGSRAPTPIELGCANPLIPCQLPNALASDPDLKQVVARTVEAGGRGDILGRQLGWSLAFFHTLSADDIQFVASSITGAGYFSNVGTTRRQGAELSLHGEAGKLDWRVNYSFVDATYRSAFSLVAADNSAADENGIITVQPGNRIPLVPRHTARLVLNYAFTPQWSAGANVVAATGQYLLENNNNRDHAGINADGALFQGSGRTAGYAVLNLNSSWEFIRRWTLFARLDNVFDRPYATSGSLGQNPFTPSGQFRTNPDDWTQESALSPAAPRAVFIGLRVRVK